MVYLGFGFVNFKQCEGACDYVIKSPFGLSLFLLKLKTEIENTAAK